MKPHTLSVLIGLALLGIWQGLAMLPGYAFLFGSPLAVGAALLEGTLSGTLPFAALVTGSEALTGFVLGVVAGTVAGFSLWFSPYCAAVARPYIVILGAIPVFAFAPMIIMWFGIGFAMKVALSAIGVFLLALSQAYDGARSIDEAEFRLLKTYGATRFQMFQKVIFPASLSWVLASMRINVGFAILGAFVGEFISSNAGLGHEMLRAGGLYDIPTVLAGGVYLVGLSLALTFLVRVVEKNRYRIIDAFA